VACELLERWPSLEELKKVPPAELRKFFDSTKAGIMNLPRGSVGAALVAAMGSQREHYGNAAEVQKHSGIAPVTETKKWAHFRWACAKFLRQSFHEWAGHSVAQSVWARAYYQQQRQRGNDHRAAVRARPSNGSASCFAAGKIT
jgi:hypothetical protein